MERWLWRYTRHSSVSTLAHVGAYMSATHSLISAQKLRHRLAYVNGHVTLDARSESIAGGIWTTMCIKTMRRWRELRVLVRFCLRTSLSLLLAACFCSSFSCFFHVGLVAAKRIKRKQMDRPLARGIRFETIRFAYCYGLFVRNFLPREFSDSSRFSDFSDNSAI